MSRPCGQGFSETATTCGQERRTTWTSKCRLPARILNMGDTYAHPAVRHRLHPAARDARGSSRCKDSGQQHVPHDAASPPTRASQTNSIITKLWPEDCFDPAMNDRVLPDCCRLLCLGVPMATTSFEACWDGHIVVIIIPSRLTGRVSAPRRRDLRPHAGGVDWAARRLFACLLPRDRDHESLMGPSPSDPRPWGCIHPCIR